ncbi:uncharacterized protein LOC135700083 [Ochlerotatus camptorhynchus]|uniref:uncharacterized protein LOC135700083 n=1 Tax=Ochlerotatus camptorhynchus TaxID=644619 RepID=UPI0031D40B3A
MLWNCLLTAWVATAVLIAAQEPDPEVDCSSVSYAFYSIEDDCSKFVFCNDGKAEEFSCRVDEYWSQQAGACVFGDSETCQDWSPEMACSGKTTGIKVPYPSDCGKFVLCSEEGDTIQDCEQGLIFENDRCVVGNLEDCESYEPKCDGKENEKLEHPDRCDAFLKCGAEEVTLEFCPEGAIFRNDIRRCVLGDLEKCEPLPIAEMCENRVNETLVHPDRCESFVQCKEGEEPSEEDCPRGKIFNSRSLNCEVGDLDTCELLDQVCVIATVGEMLEHPNGCDMHIICLQGEIPQLGFCPFGRIWRQDMMMCVPGNQASCDRASFESMCDDQPYGVIYPHPEGCSILVKCTLPYAVEIPCPAHHILQPGTLDCILGDQDKCISYNDLCIDKLYEIVALPDTDTCDAFIFCLNENPELRNCPIGDIFDATLGICSPGNNNNCELIECIHPDSVSRHPNFCNIFTRCNNGQISTQFCPFEHIFHETMKRCTPGNAMECVYDSLEEMCKGRFNDIVYPHPSTDNECIEYVLCMDGEANVNACPEGMVLRPEHLDCVPGVEKDCQVLDIVCHADEESEIVHPGRCDMKIICNNGTFTVEACPSGEIVHPDELSCVPGICEDPAPVNECSGKPDGVYEYSDCSRYVVCTNEEPSIEDCPAREIFLRTAPFFHTLTVVICSSNAKNALPTQ